MWRREGFCVDVPVLPAGATPRRGLWFASFDVFMLFDLVRVARAGCEWICVCRGRPLEWDRDGWTGTTCGLPAMLPLFSVAFRPSNTFAFVFSLVSVESAGTATGECATSFAGTSGSSTTHLCDITCVHVQFYITCMIHSQRKPNFL